MAEDEGKEDEIVTDSEKQLKAKERKQKGRETSVQPVSSAFCS